MGRQELGGFAIVELALVGDMVQRIDMGVAVAVVSPWRDSMPKESPPC